MLYNCFGAFIRYYIAGRNIPMRKTTLTSFNFSTILTNLQNQRPHFFLYQHPAYIDMLRVFFEKMQKDPFVVEQLTLLHEYDKSTFYHSVDVGFLSVCFREIFHTENKEQFSEGSLLHDIGKRYIRHNVLTKEGKLTDGERLHMQEHTVKGYDILQGHKSDYMCRLALHHHEHPEGSGYPDALCEENMKFDYFLLRIMDEFSALTLDRCYRKGLPITQAIEIITENMKTCLSYHDLNMLTTLLHVIFSEDASHKELLNTYLLSEKEPIKFAFKPKKITYAV